MHAESKDDMREKILDAALKRFSHYTVSKTTMSDIADDLHCSKASLYYYFPDKKGLHTAVLEKIADNYFAQLEAVATGITSAEYALTKTIDIRQEFIQRFCRLELFKVLKEYHTAEMAVLLKEGKEREAGIIARIFEAGVESGEFLVKDAGRIATLYIQAMMGLRFSVLEFPQVDVDLEPEEMEQVVKQQKLLNEIFIKGLKHR